MARKGEERQNDRWWLVDISGLPKELVFIELFDAAKIQGLRPPWKYRKSVEPEEVRALLEEKGGKIGFWEGRVFSLDLSHDLLNVASYDRRNGKRGMATQLIAELKKKIGDQGAPEM